MLLQEKGEITKDLMGKHINRAPICLLLLTLATLTLSSCGNGGGSETASGSGGNNNVATLSWDPPTTNVDGTSLDDLAGYKIYYGTSSGNYTGMIDITDPQKSDHTIENLASGTYYFVATAYDTSGNESDFSNEVSKTIQ